MAYFPKSKINIKETTGDEFIYSSTRKPYIGPYIEFSDGSYYAGKNPRKLGEKIERPEEIPSTFGNSKDFFKHSIIKSNIYNKLKKHKLIPTSKNKPTEKDYERGNYKRYLAKRIIIICLLWDL